MNIQIPNINIINDNFSKSRLTSIPHNYRPSPETLYNRLLKLMKERLDRSSVIFQMSYLLSYIWAITQPFFSSKAYL